ncbi:MAG: hypothetical protein LBR43_03710 [Spiroplasmataceae bacterium]|nr:hypothetical protein [Spiroplasmataceae bacterium]
MKFQEWLSAEKIDKNTVESLRIPNHLEFENDDLVIEGYPKLKELIAWSCALKRVKVDAPKLEVLNLHDNQLKELDIINTPLLESLTVSENRELNEITGLENLNNLQEFICFKCRLKKIYCTNKTKLLKLACANQFVDELELKIQGCTNLEILDCAENNIADLDCSGLTNLKDVSCKESFFDYRKIDFAEVKRDFLEFLDFCDIKTITKSEYSQQINDFFYSEYYCRNIDWAKRENYDTKKIYALLINEMIGVNWGALPFKQLENIFLKTRNSLNANFEKCSNLEQLNFSKSNIDNLNVDGCTNLKGVIGGWMDKEIVPDNNGNIQYITNSKGEREVKKKLVKPTRDYQLEPWYDPNFWIDRNKFPNLEIFHIDDEKATELEDLGYGERIYSYQQEQAKVNILAGKHLYYGTTHLDFSHMKFTAMNIDGNNYPETITLINLGDNYLRSLKVANFPNLEELIISHNTDLTKETLIIDNCPKLNKDNLPFYHYKSDDASRGTPADGREYDEETDNPLKQKAREEKEKEGVKQKINQQVRELLTKDEKDITLSELLHLISKDFFDNLEEDLQTPFLNLFTKKLESHVGELIKKVKNETLSKDQLLAEIKPLKDFLHLLSDNTKAQLRNLLESFTQQESVAVANKVSWLPFYLIFGIIFLRIGFWLFRVSKKKKKTTRK